MSRFPLQALKDGLKKEAKAQCQLVKRNPCGSEPARDDGITFTSTLTDPPLSRAGVMCGTNLFQNLTEFPLQCDIDS